MNNYTWGTYKAAGILEELSKENGHHKIVSRMLNGFFKGCNNIEDIKDLSCRKQIFLLWRTQYLEIVKNHPLFTDLEKSHLINVMVAHIREVVFRKLLKCNTDNKLPELYVKTTENKSSYKYACSICHLHSGWKYSERRAKVYWNNEVIRKS